MDEPPSAHSDGATRAADPAKPADSRSRSDAVATDDGDTGSSPEDHSPSLRMTEAPHV
jgi:hypothetical protein